MAKVLHTVQPSQDSVRFSQSSITKRAKACALCLLASHVRACPVEAYGSAPLSRGLPLCPARSPSAALVATHGRRVWNNAPRAYRCASRIQKCSAANSSSAAQRSNACRGAAALLRVRQVIARRGVLARGNSIADKESSRRRASEAPLGPRLNSHKCPH